MTDTVHDALIAWFEAEKEDLPWRNTDDPYAIWISEIMLQQTQVATVTPYYHRFLERFPTVEALATAPQSDVLKAWEGLGYYSRARNLHRAAQIVAAEHNGEFPQTVSGLQELPGIGRYTAGAVASFAFDLDAPILDGNVIRVLTRLLDIDDDVTQSATRRRLWEITEELLPEGRGPAWNEGLMELGRLICTSRTPTCDQCPVAHHCLAFERGVQAERPVKTPKAPTPHYDVTAAVIRRDDGKLLISQRPEDKMLGGLWEFPGGKRAPGESLPECLRREILEELGIEIAVGPQITTVKHAYTHMQITLYAFDCRLVVGKPEAIGVADFAWITQGELEQYAFPVTDQKIIAALDGGGQLSMDLDSGGG